MTIKSSGYTKQVINIKASSFEKELAGKIIIAIIEAINDKQAYSSKLIHIDIME